LYDWGVSQVTFNYMLTKNQVKAIIMNKKRRKQIGSLGEALVLKHLKNKGFTHLDSNFLRRQGELDLVVEGGGVIHFIEVKTVSRVNFRPEVFPSNISCNASDVCVARGVVAGVKRGNVTCETSRHLPEENVSPWKMRKLARVVQIYLGERAIAEKEWQFDVAVVYLDLGNKRAYIRFIKNIPLVG